MRVWSVLGVFGAVAWDADAYSTVVLLRHCPRAPYLTDRHGPPPPNAVFTSADNYSALPFPKQDVWGVPEGQCTAAGLQAAAELGAALKSLGLAGDAQRPTRVIADDVHRCVATAEALGLNTSSPVEVDRPLFDPLSAKIPGCTQPDWDATVQKQVDAHRSYLQDAREYLSALQTVLGQGAAPSLDSIPDVVSGGYLVGGLRVASELLAETFVLEKASSLPVAWGRVSDEKSLMDFVKLRIAYFSAQYGGLEIAQRYSSGLMARIAQQFAEAKDEVSVLVGHDLNLVALGSALGLEWQCGPWPSNGLSPLSGLAFHLKDGIVTAQSVCHTFDKTSISPMASGAVQFEGGSAKLSLEDFTAKLTSVILAECVKKTTREIVV